MSDKNFMALIVVIVVAVVGSIIIFGSSEGGGNFVGDPLQVATGEVNEDGESQRADHVFGSDDARVTLIEYGDLECPACAAFFPELKALENAYPDDLRVVFRHNPLTQLHPNAFAAHRAAVAAANQGKFWEMHDLMYERQPSWSVAQAGLDISAASEVFEGYAQALGLDMEQFKTDVASQETFDFIDSHLDSGQQLGVTGTPTIFINGEEVTERSFEELSALIDSILAGEPAATEQSADDQQPASSDETGDAVELTTSPAEEN